MAGTHGSGSNPALVLQGQSNTPATGVTALLIDSEGNVLWCTGTAAFSTLTGSGFAKGCLYIDTDIAAGTSALYANVGDTTTANFDLITDAA